MVWPGKDKNYNILIEGACIDMDNGSYYLYYSGDNCCGDKANYAVMVARSKDPFGPFETYGENNGTGSSVILEKDSVWLAPGHNSIIVDDTGNKWIAYHGIWRGKQKLDKVIEGDRGDRRVMNISPIKYQNGWPVVVK